MEIKMEVLELARLGDGTIWESSRPSISQFIEQSDRAIKIKINC